MTTSTSTSTTHGRARPAPLVEPGPELSAERAVRYSRTTRLPDVGAEAQRRIRATRVLVVGAGGLGSAVLPLLASSGFGTIGIVDDDRVELSNLPRQTVHGVADVGRPKVESAADALRALDPECDVRVIPERLTAANVERLLADVDLVIDGSDNFATRYLVNDAAVLAGMPVVWGAVHRFDGQVGVSWAAHGPHYRDLFPTAPAPGAVPGCEEAGVLPSVCGVIGALMVGQAVALVTGVGDPLLGRVLVHDGARGTFREIVYDRDPTAEPVTRLIDEEAFCGPTDTISAVELHARLTAGEAVTLLDVREPWEARMASLPDSLLVPLDAVARDPAAVAAAIARRDRDRGSATGSATGTASESRLEPGPASVPGHPLVIVCHLGIRAETARRLLESVGSRGLVLTGGIDAWAREVDPSMPRY